MFPGMMPLASLLPIESPQLQAAQGFIEPGMIAPGAAPSDMISSNGAYIPQTYGGVGYPPGAFPPGPVMGGGYPPGMGVYDPAEAVGPPPITGEPGMGPEDYAAAGGYPPAAMRDGYPGDPGYPGPDEMVGAPGPPGFEDFGGGPMPGPGGYFGPDGYPGGDGSSPGNFPPSQPPDDPMQDLHNQLLRQSLINSQDVQADPNNVRNSLDQPSQSNISGSVTGSNTQVTTNAIGADGGSNVQLSDYANSEHRVTILANNTASDTSIGQFQITGQGAENGHGGHDINQAAVEWNGGKDIIKMHVGSQPPQISSDGGKTWQNLPGGSWMLDGMQINTDGSGHVSLASSDGRVSTELVKQAGHIDITNTQVTGQNLGDYTGAIADQSVVQSGRV